MVESFESVICYMKLKLVNYGCGTFSITFDKILLWSSLLIVFAKCQEGHGRQNRKLAVALHKRHNGRSEFIVAQSTKGILCMKDDSSVGIVTSNLMGSKYNIWDQVQSLIIFK